MVLLLLVGACGKESGTNGESGSDSARRAINGGRFKGPEYTMLAPEGWETKRNVMGADLAFLSPADGATDEFRESLNVVLENLPSGITEQEYLARTKANLAKFFNDYALLDEGSVKLGGRDWWRLEYKMAQGALHMHNDVYLLVNGDGAYVVTCCFLDGENSRERYLPAMRESIASFAFDE
jgi:hypothetical protein